MILLLLAALTAAAQIVPAGASSSSASPPSAVSAADGLPATIAADSLPPMAAADGSQAVGAESTAAACPICRSVIIVRESVYAQDELAAHTFYARLANSLHIRTREPVIRRALYFREGDRVCADDIAASVRRLRTYPFLHSNTVVEGFTRSDSVDLIVRTRDSWTTHVELQFEKEGGLLNWFLVAEEDNFLGYGKSVTAGAGEEDSQTFFRAGYRDPQVLGSPFRLAVWGGHGSEGYSGGVGLTRPFERASITRALKLSGTSLAKRVVDHRHGLHGPEWDLDEWVVDVWAGRRVAGGQRTALRIMPAFYAISDHFSRHKPIAMTAGPNSIATAPLTDWKIVAPGVVFSFGHERFIELAGIDAFEHREDWDLGTEMFLETGYSMRDLGADRDGLYFRLSAQQGLPLHAGRFLLVNLASEGLAGPDKLRNSLFLGALRYYDRISQRQTVACRLQYGHGEGLLPQSAITLGAESGLRGFDAYKFWGERSVLLNVEDRVTVFEDLFGLISMGMAAFVDAGTVWLAGEREAARARVAAGLGFRFLSSRSSGTSVTRVDLGIPVAGRDGDSEIILSIGSGQAF